MDDESIRLLDRWKSGDEDAAGEIFNRYVNRLIALAGSRLSKRLKRRIAAEDIVQSAYRSFFRNAKDRYEIANSGQLWGLLAAITINKVRTQVKHHRTQKRDINAEMSATTSCYGLAPVDVVRTPNAEDEAALLEAFNKATDEMTPLQRDVFELYLQNQSASEIADHVQRSQRTVRRTIEQIRSTLENELMA